MLDIKFVRENLENVEHAVSRRGADADFKSFSEDEKKRRGILQKIEKMRNERNSASEEIARMKKAGEDTQQVINEMKELSARIKELDKGLSDIEDRIYDFMISLPNIPHPDVPTGRDEDDNSLVKEVGTIPEFDYDAKSHWEIGEALGILDFHRASKIAGARFPLYMGQGAQMERALISFMIDIHVKEHGYTETLPPFIVNTASLTGTGQLPKFKEDLFKLEGWDYYMIPTSEVPMANIYANETLQQQDLPIKFTAYTPCFRSEAGSYGKDTKGLIRQHQFNKVELVKYTTPETSYEELESLLANAEEILKRLELPYRVVTLCTGDIGFSAAKTYDIEVWMPGQNKYREISSCSNCESFQARRAGIRFKRKDRKKPEFAHTLNGSGLAVGRTFAAILENFQQEDGCVTIPDALQPYMGGDKTIHHEAG